MKKSNLEDQETLLPDIIQPHFNSDSFEDPILKTYKLRWFILFLFSAVSLANGVLYTFIVAVNDIISNYYNLPPETVEWCGNVFPFMYVFMALPSAQMMSSFGLRGTVLIATSLNAISTCLHFAGVNHSYGYPFVIAGQVCAASTFAIIMQVPVRLSTVWFPDHEHAKATSIAMIANVFGLGVGFLQSSYMVPGGEKTQTYHGLYLVYLSHIVYLLICLVLIYLFFKEKPPLPPSYSAAASAYKTIADNDEEERNSKPTMLESIKVLSLNSNYMLLTQAYALYFGLYLFYVTCLNDMVKDLVNEKDIGWMGFVADIFAIIGILISSVLIDKFKIYQKLSMTLTFGVLSAWTTFTFAMLRWKSVVSLFITYAAVSLFGAPFFVVGIEYASELTYPVAEGISSAIILMLGNLYGFLLVLFLGSWVEKSMLSIVCYIVIGLYSLCFVFVCLVKQKLNRTEAESHFQHPQVNRESENEADPFLS